MQCELCSEEHEGSYGCGRFCGEACARSFSSRHAKKQLQKERKCKTCGEVFTRKSGGTNTYCSKHRKKLSRMIDLIEDLPTDYARKQRLISKRGHQCECCKNESWLGNLIPLQLDHIDGNTDHNVEENLRLLCPNCHTFTPTYCGRNVGKHSLTKRNVYRRE